MNNKRTYLLSLITTALLVEATVVSAAPLVSIGDNTDIFFNGSSSFRWNDNVLRNESNEVDDLIWTLSPGFEINVGRGVSNADLSIITRYDIVRYQDESDLDTELFHIDVVGSYNTSRLDLTAAAGFNEDKSNTGGTTVTDDLIESDNFNASIDGEYTISPKFSFSAGLRYNEKDYTGEYGDQFADRETVKVPLKVFYELTPKVDLSLGYAYTHNDVSETDIVKETAPPPFTGLSNQNTTGYDQEAHFFSIGARGSLLPKLTGSFDVGDRLRESDDSTVSLTPLNLFAPAASASPTDREDKGMLGLDADLTYAATPKLTTRLLLSRDFGVGGEGQSTENTSVDLNASYAINSHFSASANFGYTFRDYVNSNNGREDDQIDAGLRLSYSMNQHWRFSTGYTYVENDSNEDGRSYENNMLDLTATLRY